MIFGIHSSLREFFFWTLIVVCLYDSLLVQKSFGYAKGLKNGNRFDLYQKNQVYLSDE